jgi:hypothetical protein
LLSLKLTLINGRLVKGHLQICNGSLNLFRTFCEIYMKSYSKSCRKNAQVNIHFRQGLYDIIIVMNNCIFRRFIASDDILQLGACVIVLFHEFDDSIAIECSESFDFSESFDEIGGVPPTKKLSVGANYRFLLSRISDYANCHSPDS